VAARRSRSLGWYWRRLATPLALALVSFVAAVALWVIVTREENPNRVDFFSGAIRVEAVNVPEGLAVAGITDPSGGAGAAFVSLRIQAPEDTFANLSIDDFRAEVDLSAVRQNESENRVFARYVGDEDDVEIVEVSPGIVSVTLEPLTTKVVPVTEFVAGSPPQGYGLGEIEINPPTVEVSGASSLVQQVATAGADVNLTGLRATIRQQVELVARDERGAVIQGVEILPARADLLVGIVQQEVTLALTVVPTIRGTVAEGYNLTSIVVDPPAIAVTGPLDALQALPYISTEPLELSGIRGNTTRNVLIRLPAGLRAPRDSVTVQLRVSVAQGEIALSVAPRLTGLGENLTATLQTAAVTVRLSGDQPTLAGIQAATISAVVDAVDLEAGVHVLPVTVTAPEGVTITSVVPPQVVVVIRE
jgi:YbbR domain-containing protein